MPTFQVRGGIKSLLTFGVKFGVEFGVESGLEVSYFGPRPSSKFQVSLKFEVYLPLSLARQQ